MPPGVFRNEAKTRRSYERVFTDVTTYRALGRAAESIIRFGEAEITVRDYQLEVWNAISDARAAGKDSALVHLATGLGKTTVGVVDSLDFAADFYQETGHPPKILFAVHQTEILDQAAERYRQFAPSLDQGYYAGRKRSTNQPLTFATMQALYQNLGTLDSNEFDYIIYDEAHHAQAETYNDVIKHFTPKFKLALTATPDRMDDKDIRELFGETIYSKPLAEAMVEGYLSDVDYHIVFDDAVKRAMEAGFTPDTMNDIRELLKNESRNEEIAAQIKQEMKRIGLMSAKTIVFCQDINQASEMANLLDGKPYHSAVGSEERAETLNGFRGNGVKVITTRDMFNEGVDIPDARLLVFLRSTSSRTIFEQQLGRGLRKHPGKDAVSVLDFVANIERLSQVKELSDALTEVAKQSNDCGNKKDGRDISATSTKHGLAIHTGHTDFDFEKVTIELLEKYSQLKVLVDNRTAWSSYTDDGLIALAHSQSPNAALTIPDMKRLNRLGVFPSAAYIMSRFGTVVEFQRMCGFDILDTPNWEEWTNEDIVQYAKELSPDEPITAAKLAILSKYGSFMSRTTIVNRFGSTQEFHRQCGFEVRDRTNWREVSDEDMLERIRAVSPDQPLTVPQVQKLYKEGDFPNMSLIAARFGGIYNLNFRLGHRTEARTNWREVSDEDIIKVVIGYSPDKHLSSQAINELSKQGVIPSRGFIESRFGSLKEFYRRCGYSEDMIRERKDWSDLDRDSLITLALSISPDKPITEQMLSRYSKEGLLPSKRVVKNIMGGLVELQTACGFNPSVGTKVELTAEDIIGMARKISPDRQITTSEISNLYRTGRFPSLDVVRNRFGNIKNFQAMVWGNS